MKQLAVCSLGWGIGMLALIQLPALSNSSVVKALPSSNAIDSGVTPLQAQPTQYLLAVALTRNTLGRGDIGRDVEALQRFLIVRGFYQGPEDGIYGESTVSAVLDYQRRRDLAATGVADEETLRDMGFDFLPGAASNNTQIAPSSGVGTVSRSQLTPGSTGDDVVALQRRLNEVGYRIAVDGDYGTQTEQAVRNYQWANGLEITGTADSATLRSLGVRVAADSRPYVAAILADQSQLRTIRSYFPEAEIDDSFRQGTFINIGSFASRSPAEARVDAARARGYSARVLFR